MDSETPERARPVPEREKMKLYRMAMGQCSFRGCRAELVHTPGDPRFMTQVAHIAGKNRAGPRGDDPLPMKRRHLYENLILLCASHHVEIDTFVERYQPSTLREMKSKHESRIAQLQRLGTRWSQNYLTVDYLNLPRFLMFPSLYDGLSEPERAYTAALTTLRGLGAGVASVLRIVEPRYAIGRIWRCLYHPAQLPHPKVP